jgi:hypothetical protein
MKSRCILYFSQATPVYGSESIPVTAIINSYLYRKPRRQSRPKLHGFVSTFVSTCRHSASLKGPLSNNYISSLNLRHSPFLLEYIISLEYNRVTLTELSCISECRIIIKNCSLFIIYLIIADFCLFLVFYFSLLFIYNQITIEINSIDRDK